MDNRIEGLTEPVDSSIDAEDSRSETYMIDLLMDVYTIDLDGERRNWDETIRSSYEERNGKLIYQDTFH